MNKWLQNAFVATCTMASLTAVAKPPAPPRPPEKPPSELLGIYFGGFGGWIFPETVGVSQRGTAFFPDSGGGALDVAATGTAQGRTKGFGGVHIGYEWMNEIRPGFRLAPALELEGSYFANTIKTVHVDNPTDRVDAHEFMDTLPTRIGTLLANGILEFNNDYISPYIGIGVGAGFVSIHNADSLQIDPPESGINHFNSDPSDFTTLFAAQAKAGLRYRFLKHYRLSAEYRFTYLTSSDFIFGSTRYADHAPTSPWIVQLDGMRLNAFTLGIDFIF